MNQQRKNKYKHIKNIRVFDEVIIYDIKVSKMHDLPDFHKYVPTFKEHISNPMFVQKINNTYFLSFAVDYNGVFKTITKHEFLSIIIKRTMNYDGIISSTIPLTEEDLYQNER